MNAHKELQTGGISGVFDQKLVILDFDVLSTELVESFLVFQYLSDIFMKMISFKFACVKMLMTSY